ncbi:hypothetical protein EDD18DRAFT_1358090 [Armillaria luteobubalina]|uniref:Uncharacterized protein n=1 Tax=Armillaria luteobubalina TaxID=153913 RepID=A0AA39UTD9_9AGAR|nr:hypothetical protein EDD18DRAFT_1364629 [Armillaria luteobubalina]KAK0492045.1 hypothetical protein EDD18DRAFT_1358090 [Armillaria luteobubalina]
MSDPAIHENPSPGIPLDEQDLRFDYFWDFASFFDKDSDDTFEIHAESVPSASTISGGLHGCHPYLDVGTIEETIIGVLRIPRLYCYAIRLDYSAKQLLWLADQGPLFESFVLADCSLTFFQCLYSQWFNKWQPINKAEREQQKIEIFTLFIMGLKYRWIDHGPKPSQWTTEQVFERLDHLEEIVMAEYEKISHVFRTI